MNTFALLGVYITIVLNQTNFVFEVASTVEERALGMMGREEWAEIDGMLFVHEEPQRVAYWMKNTALEMEILYLNEDFKIMEIYTGVPFDLTPHYSDSSEILYVLEIPPDSLSFILENQEELSSELQKALFE